MFDVFRLERAAFRDDAETTQPLATGDAIEEGGGERQVGLLEAARSRTRGGPSQRNYILGGFCGNDDIDGNALYKICEVLSKWRS